MDLLIGTNNAGKLREYGEIFAGLPLRLLSVSEAGLDGFAPDEPYDTFLDNALHKARLVCQRSGLPALADDSGLMIEALDGRPGVYSARYAGPGASDDDRMNKVLSELNGLPDAQRGAQFVCVAALALPDGRLQTAEGVVRGRIAHAPGERQHGFGYDPIFVPNGFTKTFAELGTEQKEAIGHRGKASRKILSNLDRMGLL